MTVMTRNGNQYHPTSIAFDGQTAILFYADGSTDKIFAGNITTIFND